MVSWNPFVRHLHNSRSLVHDTLVPRTTPLPISDPPTTEVHSRLDTPPPTENHFGAVWNSTRCTMICISAGRTALSDAPGSLATNTSSYRPRPPAQAQAPSSEFPFTRCNPQPDWFVGGGPGFSGFNSARGSEHLPLMNSIPALWCELTSL